MTIRRRRTRWLVVLVLFLGPVPVPSETVARSALSPQIRADTDPGETVRGTIRRRIEAAAGPADLPAGDQRVHTESSALRMYESRQFQPAWSSEGKPTSLLDQLLASIRSADRHGLLPGDYHVSRIEETLEQVRSARPADTLRVRRLADLDLLATDAYLLLASHLLGGRVDPESFESNWVASRRTRDLVAHLENALERGRIRASLRELESPQPEYARLVDEHQRYRSLAREGGWPKIPAGPTLRPGDEDGRVATVRERLRIEGYEVGDSTGTSFGSELEEAVRSFQDRHGVEADGVIGPRTLRDMNVSPGARADQIALNMERWRWLPQELGDPHVLVNIAGFRLDVVENGRSVMNMRVIVGRPYRTTPVFSDRISYLVFSPYWHVPHSIATQDILPQVKQDPAYLQQQSMRVFQGWASDARSVDPASIDWSRLSVGTFPYRLRQEPGPTNALGRVKFMFPNRFNVYLHDTPSRGLFSQAVRTFSSGCIRVEDPLGLSEYLLREQPEWTSDRIRTAMQEDREQTVHLANPIPVHLLYWTAWVDDDGAIYFHGDVYGRDARLEAALNEEPPKVRTRP